MTEENTQWQKARKKPIIVEFREAQPLLTCASTQLDHSEKFETVQTKNGRVIAVAGKDYVVRGVEGELYPINKGIFAETYDVLDVNSFEEKIHEYQRAKTLFEIEDMIKKNGTLVDLLWVPLGLLEALEGELKQWLEQFDDFLVQWLERDISISKLKKGMNYYPSQDLDLILSFREKFEEFWEFSQ